MNIAFMSTDKGPMKKIIIFGVNDFAELAHYYLQTDTEHEVVAFSVSSQFLPESKQFCGLPVIDFDKIETILNPEEYYFFAPMSPSKMNRARELIFSRINSKGYKFISYVSSKATILTNSIGANCFILENNTIQPFVEIGNNCVIWSGNHIGHHTKIDEHVTITSHVVISGHCKVGKNCFLGVNSTISNHIDLAEGTLVSLSTCIESDTKPWSVYKGIPATILNMPSHRIKL